MNARPTVFVGAGAATGASRADVEIDARVAADELVAHARPLTRSEPVGDPRSRMDRLSTRRNLPGRLEPGVVERRIAAHRRVAARVPDPEEVG